MKLTFKTLQQQSFSLEAEPTQKVSEIKSAIESLKGIPAATQKLIHSGKILDDNATIESLKISEKDFIVVMATKPKPAPSASASASANTSAAAPATAAPATAAPATTASATAATPSATTTAASAAPSGESTSLVTGSVYETSVNNLVEMGFPRDQVVRAMRAAFNNPDRAAEYLMTGIPDSVEREMSAPAAPSAPSAAVSQPAAAADAPATGAPVNLFEAAAAQAASQTTGRRAGPLAGMSPAQVQEAFAAIRNSPQFEQIRQIIRTDPRLLNPILQQLGQSDPQLFTLITQNQDQFLQMLAADLPNESAEEDDAQFVSVTPEEEAAINRLTALGFERSLAIEAFFACDKNEELAANYLFDQNNGDDWS